MFKRNAGLLIWFGLLGPGLGWVAHFSLSVIFSKPQELNTAFLMLTIVGTYLAGFPPALFTALSIVALSGWLAHPWQRFAACAVIGAVSSLIMMFVIFWFRFRSNVFNADLSMLRFYAAYGAIAAVICLALAEKCLPQRFQANELEP